MEKVRPWCGQPSDRGRLKNRTERVFFSQITLIIFIVVNRQIGVQHTKNVIVFDTLHTGHVIRRMRSGIVRIFNGNQRKTLWLINQELIGVGSSNLVARLVTWPPCTAAVQGQKVKSQGHKVTWRISRQTRYNSAVYGHINFKLGGNYRRGVEACGIISRSVGQTKTGSRNMADNQNIKCKN